MFSSEKSTSSGFCCQGTSNPTAVSLPDMLQSESGSRGPTRRNLDNQSLGYWIHPPTNLPQHPEMKMDNKQSQRTTKSNQVRLPKEITGTAWRVQPHVSKMWIICNVCQITFRNCLYMLIICKWAWYWHTMPITYHYISWRIITLVLDETARRDLQPRPCSGSPSAMTGGKSNPYVKGLHYTKPFPQKGHRCRRILGMFGCLPSRLVASCELTIQSTLAVVWPCGAPEMWNCFLPTTSILSHI